MSRTTTTPALRGVHGAASSRLLASRYSAERVHGLEVAVADARLVDAAVGVQPVRLGLPRVAGSVAEGPAGPVTGAAGPPNFYEAPLLARLGRIAGGRALEAGCESGRGRG